MSVVNEHNKPPHIRLPNFEPLPPDRWWNRLINNLLKPIFYLFFTLITSIVVIPVYTVIENMKNRNRQRRGGAGGGSAYTVNGQPVERSDGSMQHFLHDYGNTYKRHSGHKH